MNKKFSMRAVLGLLLAVAMASGCLAGCSQAPSSTASSSAASSATVASSASSAATVSDEMVVLVEIDPSAADGKVDLPTADLAVASQDVALPNGANAYDALAATGATLEGSSSYVTSINGLAEKAAGSTYGWMYEVNGEAPTVAANDYVLQAGDTVRWYYGSWEDR